MVELSDPQSMTITHTAGTVTLVRILFLCTGDEEKQVCALKVLFYLFYPKKTENFIYVYEEYPVSQFYPHICAFDFTPLMHAGCYSHGNCITGHPKTQHS